MDNETYGDEFLSEILRPSPMGTPRFGSEGSFMSHEQPMSLQSLTGHEEMWVHKKMMAKLHVIHEELHHLQDTVDQILRNQMVAGNVVASRLASAQATPGVVVLPRRSSYYSQPVLSGEAPNYVQTQVPFSAQATPGMVGLSRKFNFSEPFPQGTIPYYGSAQGPFSAPSSQLGAYQVSQAVPQVQEAPQVEVTHGQGSGSTLKTRKI